MEQSSVGVFDPEVYERLSTAALIQYAVDNLPKQELHDHVKEELKTSRAIILVGVTGALSLLTTIFLIQSFMTLFWGFLGLTVVSLVVLNRSLRSDYEAQRLEFKQYITQRLEDDLSAKYKIRHIKMEDLVTPGIRVYESLLQKNLDHVVATVRFESGQVFTYAVVLNPDTDEVEFVRLSTEHHNPEHFLRPFP